MIAARAARRILDDGISGSFAAVQRAVGRSVFRMRGARPWERATLDLARSGGLGDVLMCTPIVREIKRRNPDCRVRFFTDYGILVDGLPQFDEVLPFSARRWTAFHLEYRAPVPVGTHLAQAMASNIGMEIEDCRPDCIVRPEAAALVSGRLAAAGGRPIIAMQRIASRWTSNKQWPEANWRELARLLRRDAFLVEIGEPEATPSPVDADLDLRGATTLAELAAVVAAADLVIGPDSGPIHIAAGVGTPSITLYGGYLHPSHTRYDGNEPFYTSVHCAPCWLRDPCPYGMPCMTAITPQVVCDAALRRIDDALRLATLRARLCR